MQPAEPIAETAILLFPSLRFCIVSSPLSNRLIARFQSPCTLIFEVALSISRRSSETSSIVQFRWSSWRTVMDADPNLNDEILRSSGQKCQGRPDCEASAGGNTRPVV